MRTLPKPARPGERLPSAVLSAPFAWSEAQADARGRAASRDPLKLLMGAMGAADVAVVFGLSLLASLLRNGMAVPLDIVTTSVLGSLLMANALPISGAYTTHIKDSLIAQIWLAAQAWTVVFVLLLTMGYLTKTLSEYSRFWAILWYALVILGFAAVRLIAAGQLRRWRSRGRLASTVAIVDLSGAGADFVRRLTRNGAADIRLLGVFSPDEVARPRTGVTDLIALSRLFRIDEVFVLVAASGRSLSAAQLSAILRRLGTIPTNVRICPLLPELYGTPIRDTVLVHDLPMLTVHRRPLDAWNSIAKRVEDLLLGCLLVVLTLPAMAMCAVAIKLDSPGPVLFRQARQGFNNNIIMVLKFRSMTHTAQPDERVAQATRNDRRVTRVGRILRRTSLDELPQLFNVLRGEMSLVGPRPHAVVHNQQYAALIDDYLGRHRVQPGLTGWAQVNGLRGETDTLDKMQKRVEYDLVYINNWSIALDLKIIALTPIAMLFDRHAY
jgi:Undecaprenyl-phosphate glucose phosphotransferase